MPHAFVVALAPLVAVILGSRFLFAALPPPRASVPMSAADAVVAGLVIPPWRHTGGRRTLNCRC